MRTLYCSGVLICGSVPAFKNRSRLSGALIIATISRFSLSLRVGSVGIIVERLSVETPSARSRPVLAHCAPASIASIQALSAARDIAGLMGTGASATLVQARLIEEFA